MKRLRMIFFTLFVCLTHLTWLCEGQDEADPTPRNGTVQGVKNNNSYCDASNITCTHGEPKIPNINRPGECICACDSSKYTGDFCQFNVNHDPTNPNLTTVSSIESSTVANVSAGAAATSSSAVAGTDGPDEKPTEEGTITVTKAPPGVTSTEKSVTANKPPVVIATDGVATEKIPPPVTSTIATLATFTATPVTSPTQSVPRPVKPTVAKPVVPFADFAPQDIKIIITDPSGRSLPVTQGGRAVLASPSATENLCTTQNRCLNGGKCRQISATETSCTCDEYNFYGEYCQFTKGCQAFSCQNGGTCSTNGKDSRCQCPPGFMDPTCSTRDPCLLDTITCLNNGRCERLSNKHGKCNCPEGWLGERCEISKPCQANNPCLNAGGCTATSDGYDFVCSCASGFYGRVCQFRDPCIMDKVTCNGRGACERITDMEWRCRCQGEDYYGKNCETARPQNLCETVFAGKCLNNGKCHADSLALGVKCSCQAGYSGTYCEHFNPCKLSKNRCHNGGTCTRIDDSDMTECACQPSFSGRNCEHYSACASSPCLHATGCEDIRNDYYCKCMDGWQGRQCTIQIPQPQTFTNFVDNYCVTRFLGKCANGATCISFGENEYECVCPPEFTGKDCTQGLLLAKPQNNAAYTPLNNPAVAPSHGQTGRAMSARSPVTPTQELPWGKGWVIGPQRPLSRGRAISSASAAVSTPAPCPTGAPCDFCGTKYAGVCQNGGVCITATATASFYECECKPTHEGKNCQNDVPITKCTINPCGHGGMCVLHSDGNFHCDCRAEFMGDRCEERDPCLLGGDSDCLNGGTCVRENDIEYRCECRVPYKGDQCEEEDLCLIDPDECIDDLIPGPKCFPCKPDETCLKIGSEQYSCNNIPVSGTGRTGVDPDFDYVYPRAARVNEVVTFQMRFLKTIDSLMWFFDDEPYSTIDEYNCNDLFKPRDPADLYFYCSFTRAFYVQKSYTVKVDSPKWSTNRVLENITIYDKCVPSVRIHNVGHTRKQDYPSVELTGNRLVEDVSLTEFHRGTQVVAWATVYMDCELEEQPVQICSLALEWRLDDENKPEPDSTESTFVIDTNKLSAHRTYTIYVTANITFTEKNVDCSNEDCDRITTILTDNGVFHIIMAYPVAVIQGGSQRILGVDTKIVLNGSQSYDPEDLTGVHLLKFTWTCESPLGPPCDALVGSFTPKSVQQFDPNTLQKGTTYVFKLVVTSTVPPEDTRMDEFMQTIQVEESPIPEFSLSCVQNCEKEINRENALVLKCECAHCSLRSDDWDLTVEFVNPDDLTKAPISIKYQTTRIIVDPSTKTSQIYIQIDPDPTKHVLNMLYPSDPYPEKLQLRFTCSASVKTIAPTARSSLAFIRRGGAQLQVYPFRNLPKIVGKSVAVPSPKTGCIILPLSATAYAFKTYFILLCDEFTTIYPPLTFTVYAKVRAEYGRGRLHEYEYKFGYPIRHDITTLLSSDPIFSRLIPYYQFVLPAGHPRDGFNLPITVKISDAFGRAVYFRDTTVIYPIDGALNVLQNWYLNPHGKFGRDIMSKNYNSVLQHALAYFHHASVADPLTISPLEKDRITSLKTVHIYHFQQISRVIYSFNQVEHVNSVTFAVIHGDLDKALHGLLFDAALILGSRLLEGLGLKLRRILRTPYRGFSSKTDLFDDPAVYAVIKSGVLTVMDMIGPLNSLHHEFFADANFNSSDPDAPSLEVNLNSVNQASPKILEALEHFSDCFGSRISVTHTPIAYPHKGYFAIFVQIIHETELSDPAGKRAPSLVYPVLLPDLLRKNYVNLSPQTKVTLSAGNFNKFLQIAIVVSMFNPYLSEKIRTDDTNLQVNIEAPLFLLEIQDDFDSRKLNYITESGSPHVFQLTFFDVDHTASNIQARSPAQINIDVFSVPDVERHEFLVSLPPNSTFMVGVEVYGVRDVDLYIGMTMNDRPTCQELYDQSKNNSRFAFGDRVGGVAYELFTSSLDTAPNTDKPIGTHHCPDCNDYYIIMWPTPDTKIPVSMNKNLNDSLDVLVGFSHLKCFSKQQIIGSPWIQDCISGPSLPSHPHTGMTCSCQHMSVIAGSLVPLVFSNQDFLKIDLFSDLRDGLIIPYVVLSFLILYAILLAIFIYVDLSNYKRPKLIVMGDLQRLRVDSFYIVTVETGNDWFGGTTAKVLCQIFGDKGQTKPMVLSNYILDTMRENDEQSFLISTPNPLGEIKKIQLSHDNSGPTPSWFCRRVIIRDIKTDQTWFFFVERWLSTWKGSASLSCSVPLATPAEVEQRFANKFTWRGYWRSIREHHIWISHVTCPARSLFKRCERITCWMATVCCYMLFNLILYNIPREKYDGGIISFEYVHIGQYDPVFANGTKGSLCGIWIGIICVEAFKLIRRRMLPVLVVFDAETGKDTDLAEEEVEIAEVKPEPEPIPVRRAPELMPVQRAPEILSPIEEVLPVKKKSKRRHRPPRVPLPFPERKVAAIPCRCGPSNHLVPGSCFRVPSTDIVKTEKWIEQMQIDECAIVSNLVEMLHYEDDFVRRYCHPKRVKKCGATQVNKPFLNCTTKPFTRVLGPTTTYMPEPYQTESNHRLGTHHQRGCSCKVNKRSTVPYAARILSILTETMADPIQKQTLCPKCECGQPRLRPVPCARISQRSTRSVMWEPVPSVKSVSACPSMVRCPDPPPPCVCVTVGTQAEDEPMEGRVLDNNELVKYELGSILYHYQRCQPLPYRPFIYIAWCLCLSIIIVASTLTIYYGCRFGWIKSIDWCISCIYTFTESFFIIQPLKCLIYYSLTLLCARKCHRHHPNADQVTVKARFKLIWMSGRTTGIKIWPLNYIIHPLRIQELSGLPKDFVITKSGYHSTGLRHRRYSECQITAARDTSWDWDRENHSTRKRRAHHSADDVRKKRSQSVDNNYNLIHTEE